MRVALVFALLQLALAASLAPVTPARAQIQLAEASPPDGARLDDPPESVRLCFSEQIIGTFRARYTLPDGRVPTLRFALLANDRCLDVQALLPRDAPQGQYTFQWEVTAAEDGAMATDTLRVGVGEDAAPAPSPPSRETPPAVATPGATSPSPTAPAATPRPADTPPALTPPAGGDAGESEGGGSETDADDGPDILLIALITIGAVGAAAVVGTLAYLLRVRVGYEPHRPPDEGEEGGGEGH